MLMLNLSPTFVSINPMMILCFSTIKTESVYTNTAIAGENTVQMYQHILFRYTPHVVQHSHHDRRVLRWEKEDGSSN